MVSIQKLSSPIRSVIQTFLISKPFLSYPVNQQYNPQKVWILFVNFAKDFINHNFNSIYYGKGNK